MKNFFSQLDMCGLFDGIASEDIDSMLSCLKAKIIGYKKVAPFFWKAILAAMWESFSPAKYISSEKTTTETAI